MGKLLRVLFLGVAFQSCLMGCQKGDSVVSVHLKKANQAGRHEAEVDARGMRLTGVVNVTGGKLGLLEDTNDLGYIVKEGQSVSALNGVVERIGINELVVRQSEMDAMGKKYVKYVSLKLGQVK